MTFEAPVFLLFLALVPAGVYFRHIHRGRGGLVPFAFDSYGGAGFRPRANGLRFAVHFSALLFWAGLIMLVLALAGPVMTARERIFLSRGIDIMIVLDESPTMAAQDFQPGNRFEVARDVIRRFVRGRENDPVGLVSFSAEAALRVPLTLDYDFLEERLDSLSIMDLGDGTAIGMGLAVASVHLRSSTAREKVIILLTDGVNNMGEIAPETAAEIAGQLGIRIYAIGIGGVDETLIEFTDPRSGKTYRGSLQGGFDETLIREIAERSGGAYFYAGSPGTLESVFQAIDSIERTERRVRIDVKSIPIHRNFILIGLLLVMLDFAIRKGLLREAA